MGDSKDSTKPVPSTDVVTAGPWRGGIAAVVRVRWAEQLPNGSAQLRAETFATMEEAEAYTHALEARGIEATIG